MKVRELMSTELVTLTKDDTLADAERCMARGRIRHIPVVKGRRLLGLVTHRDILAASFSILAEVDPTEQRRVFATVLVGDIMHTEVAAVAPGTAVSEAARLLLKNKYGCLPVVDTHRNLEGIITEADFLRLTVRLLP
jgi:CBS domain-containing membrane protein